MELTEVSVRQGLQELYGSGHGSPQISSVTLLGTGYETDVFAFSLEPVSAVGARRGLDLVLRVYGGEGTAEKARREFAVMDRLHAAGYPVPRVLGLTRDPSPFDRPYVIMERIHGVSLGLSFWGATKDRQNASQLVLYQLMVALHALEGRAMLPDSPLAHSTDAYDFIDHELALLSDMIYRLEGSEPPSLRGTLAWLMDRRPTVPCARLSVIHGDFHYGNVLVRPDGAPFVIDWSNARLGDLRMDLAWTRLIAAITEPDTSPADLPLYEGLTGKAVSGLEYFEAIACMRLLSNVLVSLHLGAARQGLRPDTEVRMRRDVDLTCHVAARLQERTGVTMTDFDDALTVLITR
jgi:aminoglycoside phosphotransferase (APT) family kinase protein